MGHIKRGVCLKMSSITINLVLLLQLMMICIAGGNVMDFDVHVSSGFIYWADFASVAVERRVPTHVSPAVRKVNVRRIKPDGADYADVIAVSAHMNSTAALAINWVTGMMPRCSRVFELKIILAFAYELLLPYKSLSTHDFRESDESFVVHNFDLTLHLKATWVTWLGVNHALLSQYFVTFA